MIYEIENMLGHTEDPMYHTLEFRNMIENHILYLIEGDNAIEINVENKKADASDGDFYNLLHLYDVDPDYHWVVLRMNGLTSPSEYRSDMTTILTPRDSVISALVKRFKTTQSMGVKRKK